MHFKNLSVVSKLAIGFGSALVMLLAMLVVAKRGLGEISGDVDKLGSRGVIGTVALCRAQATMILYRMEHYHALAYKDQKTRDAVLDFLDKYGKEVDEHLKEFGATLTSPSDKTALEDVRTKWAEYVRRDAGFIEGLKQANYAQAEKVAIEDLRPYFIKELEPAFNSIYDSSLQGASQLSKNAMSAASTAGKTSMAAFVLALVLCSTLGIVVARSIVGPLKVVGEALHDLEVRVIPGLQDGVNALAQGDLCHPVNIEINPVEGLGQDEVGRMGERFNSVCRVLADTGASFDEACGSLRAMIRVLADRAEQLRKTSGNLDAAAKRSGLAAESTSNSVEEIAKVTAESTSATEQIAKASQDLAALASKSAGLLRDLATQASVVSEQTQQQELKAESASSLVHSVRNLSENAAQGLQKASESVDLTSSAVQELGAKQAQIGAIAETIEGIAGQTNLLALNAAIEAAQAGEHGHGFAVVAEEVRKLAEKSGEASRQIGVLISEIRAKVDQASKAMDQTLVSVHHGVEQFESVKEELVGISGATEEVTQIARGNRSTLETMKGDIESVTDTASNVAAVAEEAAAGAEEMSAGSGEASSQVLSVSEQVRLQMSEIGQVTAIADQLAELANEVASMSGRFKFETASDSGSILGRFREAHRGWVSKVEDMVHGGRKIARDELISHHNCQLGIWYDGGGKATFGHTAEFKAIEEPHKRVHEAAREAVDAMGAGDRKGAELALKKIRLASKEVCEGLDKLGEVTHMEGRRKAA